RLLVDKTQPRNPGSSPPPTIPAPQRCSIPTSAGKTATASNTAGPAEATNPSTTTARKPQPPDGFPGRFNTQNEESIHTFCALTRIAPCYCRVVVKGGWPRSTQIDRGHPMKCCPAVSYSPTPSRVQYHRRCGS